MAILNRKLQWSAFFIFLCLVIYFRLTPIKKSQLPNIKVTELTLSRFFGSCTDQYSDVTDLSRAEGECGIIQVLTNKFNAENKIGAFVKTQTTEWSAYYNHLSAAFAAKHPPDIAIMHQSALPNFVKQGLVIPLKDKLLLAGLPLNDLLPAAKEGVTFNNEIYALPFDFHALLWHLNLDLLTQAGLVDKEGNPMLPSNKQDLFAHARYVKERTGKRYLAIPSQTDPMPTWLFESWVWQQGAELFSADLQSALINSRAAQVSLQTLNGLYQNGYADPYQDYMGAEQTFLSGNSAILLNGTWVVNSYTNLAKKGQVNLKHYRAVSIPQLFQLKAAWTDSHIWVLPQKIETDPNKLAAAIAFLKFLFENNFEWAKTGHLPVRQSVLDSPEFQVLPSRKFYRDTAEMAHTFPFIENQQSIRDALSQHINATWLTPKNPEESLNQAQHQIQRILDEN